MVRRTNSFDPMPNEELSTFAHAVREANRMGDMGDNGVKRVGDKGTERVNEGDDDKGDDGKGDDDSKGDDDKGVDIDKDESDGIEADDEAGDIGRGRIRRALCVVDIVCGHAFGGTAGKARARRGGVTFFITEAPWNLLPSILTGNLLLDLWRAPRGWRVKVALSLL